METPSLGGWGPAPAARGSKRQGWAGFETGDVGQKREDPWGKECGKEGREEVEGGGTGVPGAWGDLGPPPILGEGGGWLSLFSP